VLLIYLSCAFVLGIWLGSSFNVPLVLSLTGLVPLPLLLLARHHRWPLVFASLGLFVIFASAAYGYASLHDVDEDRLHFYNDRGVVEIKGMVAAAPDVRDKTTRLSLAAAEIRLEDGWREVGGTVLVFVPRYPAYGYGDSLRVTGELATPPQLGDFDYRGYLAHQGIYATMLYPGVEVLEAGGGFRPMAWIYSLRDRLAQSLSQALPEPQASLAQGVVLGVRGNIPEALQEEFARSGTAHLLAISGLHLGIMAGILLAAGIWLFGRRRYLYVWLALVAVWLYALITGMNPPVVRAAIMASLFLAAELLGRQRSAIVALTFAAAVMVGVSPYILGDASFQLSFLAMAGLVFLFPAFRNLGRMGVRRVLGEDSFGVATANFAVDALSATLAAVIAVWPVVAYYFGIVSLVGPLATFLALPALPGIIVLGALTAVLGLVALPVAQVFGWLAWVFLSYMGLVVGGLAAPWVSSVEVGSISPVFVWGYYVFLAAAVWLVGRWYRRRELAPVAAKSYTFSADRLKRWAVAPLLAIAVLVSCVAATMPDDRLHVSFLDVGQGDAVLVQKGSRQILVDGGPSPQTIGLEMGERMPFWDRTIDLLVLTHPHDDHLAGLVEVLRRYRVERVLYPPLDGGSPLYDEWLRLIEEKNVARTLAAAGQRIDLGDGVVIDVLAPAETLMAGTDSDIDNNSVVLRLSAGDFSFLLTGDIMREAEWALVGDRAAVPSTVLKVAHHGSATSTSSEFLAVVSPQLAVISVGADNRFGHPTDAVLARLEEVVSSENIYRTDEDGAIEFITDGERLWVEVEK
jgi:competence protein ComEC